MSGIGRRQEACRTSGNETSDTGNVSVRTSSDLHGAASTVLYVTPAALEVDAQRVSGRGSTVAVHFYLGVGSGFPNVLKKSAVLDSLESYISWISMRDPETCAISNATSKDDG
jgi:hypothetical protein